MYAYHINMLSCYGIRTDPVRKKEQGIFLSMRPVPKPDAGNLRRDDLYREKRRYISGSGPVPLFLTKHPAKGPVLPDHI